MDTRLGRYVLEKLQVYSPFSGITTNQSEAFNSVLKRLQNWREVPIDAIVLGLYHLQAFYLNEVRRGFAGLGSYSLSDEFEAAKQSPDEIQTITVYSPLDIVDQIRKRVCSETNAVSPGLPLFPSISDGGQKDSPADTQYARARQVNSV